jgi:predicted RNA-binding protein associated with RNAse of E/G family
MADLVSYFDYHPYEPHVRQFRMPHGNVLRFYAEVYVCDALFDDVMLRHFAFRDEWFKINVTLDEAGRLVETPGGPGHPPFAFNCDVATPMVTHGSAVYAVDLYADVLVAADGVSHLSKDVLELEEAAATGLLSEYERQNAYRGLDRLLGLVKNGELWSYLNNVCSFGPSGAGPALPMVRVPLADVPELQPRHRLTWEPEATP